MRVEWREKLALLKSFYQDKNGDVVEFEGKLFQENLARIAILSKVGIVIALLLLLVAANQYYYLMYFLLLGILLIFLFFEYRAQKQNMATKAVRLFFSLLGPFLLLLWASLLTILDGQIVAYAILVFALSMTFYLKPILNFINLLISYFILIFIWARVASSYSQLMGVYINGSVVIVLGWLINAVFYYYCYEIFLKDKKIKALAYFDELTGLANRRFFQEEFNKGTREDKLLGIVFMDLDGFKDINDNFGHLIGDEVLKKVGERLQEALGQDAVISRVGGDEFNILLKDLANEEEGLEIVSRISKAFTQSFQIKEQSFQISFSLGISFYPRDGQNLEELLMEADRAMYLSKGRSIKHLQLNSLIKN